MYIIIETSRSGLCHLGNIFGGNPKIKETIINKHSVLTWHGCKAVQVRPGDPWIASAYAFACSDKTQARAFAREIPGFRVYDPNDYHGAYQIYRTDPPKWVKDCLR